MTRSLRFALLGSLAAVTPQLADAGAQKPSAGFDVRLDQPLVQGGIARGRVPPGTTDLMLDDHRVTFAADGTFLIALDRDAGPQATLTLVDATGTQLQRSFTVTPRDWPIQRINRVARFPQPSAEFAARRPAELARIAAARAQTGDAHGWRQAFIWPTTGRISGRFGSQRIYRGEPGAYHSGVDIARPSGTPVLAPADGTVVLAADRDFTLEGRLLIVDHGMGLNSAFLHLSRIDVHEGTRVRRGQVIGAVGASGRAAGPHLHWGMMWHGARIDPMLVAGPMPRDDDGNAQEPGATNRHNATGAGTAPPTDD